MAALIAAFEDAGKPSCAPVELAERLGLDARKVAVLCKALKDAGRLEQTRNCRGKPAMWRRYRILLRETER